MEYFLEGSKEIFRRPTRVRSEPFKKKAMQEQLLELAASYEQAGEAIHDAIRDTVVRAG